MYEVSHVRTTKTKHIHVHPDALVPLKNYLQGTSGTIQEIKHFKEMNSYVGMTVVKKEQGQDYYFSQQAYFSQLPAHTSPDNQ